MKKILFISLILLCTAAHADERSKALLTKMGAAIRGWKQYQVEFTLHAGEASKPIPGNFKVSGQKYYLSVEDREVYCDGTIKYEVNRTDKEVTVDQVDPKDKSILANPTRAFDFSDDVFTHSYGGQTTFGGKKCDVVILRARSADDPILEIKLMLDAASGLPAAVSYRMENVSEPVQIDVTSIKPAEVLPESQFRFDRSKYKGYEVIDFR